MRNRVAFAAGVLALALMGTAQVAVAAENVPGSACTTAKHWQWAGGPENSGVVNGMFCNGSTWTGIINFQSSGNVGIGTSTPADTLHIHTSSATGNAGITVSSPGTGTNQQTWLSLVTKGTAGATLGAVGIQGWQVWANADNTSGYGGTDALGIGYANGGGGWNPPAIVITPSDQLGIWNAYPKTDFDIGTAFALSGDISPSQLTANQNNYNPAGMDSASVVRLTSNASRTITGLVGGTDGRILTIMNVGSNPIVLANQNTSSSAANRFAISADITLGADQSASLIYDTTSQRWRSASLPFSAAGCSVYSFSFPAIAPQPASTLVSSPILPISTNACSAAVTISGVGSPQFRICADSSCATVVNNWGSTSQTTANGQFVQARLTTSASNSTDVATLAVGSTLGNFSVDTAASYKLMFITSALYSPNLGGVLGADAKCASAATAAGRAGTYMAWIADSTDASAPASRFTQASVPYRTVNLAKVADNWAGLTSGMLATTVNTDENGSPSSISNGNFSGQKPFFSNVNADGTRVGTANCTNWTATTGSAAVGDAKQTGSTWSNSTTQSCGFGLSIHVLCVQQ